MTVLTIKPTFPKEEEKLARKKIDTIEKYVVKIHSRDLRHKNEGASLCDQHFLLKNIHRSPSDCKEGTFFISRMAGK